MANTLPTQRGLYFEEFFVGQKVITPSRTITETDVVNFAGLSGDYNQLHTDAEFGKSTPYGERIAHGLLVLSIATGLTSQTGVLEGTALLFREIENWKFVQPVFIGDTVHAELEVVNTKALPRVNGGAVKIKVSIKNQEDVVVMKGFWTALMALKPQ